MAKKSPKESKKLYGVDIETHDPHLTDKGESWIWNEGEILVASAYDAQTKKTGLYRGKELSYFKTLFKDPEAKIIGASISYDILWLCHVLKIKVTDIKAEIVDIQITEALVNPFTDYNLGFLANKYLREDKGSEALVLLAKKHKLSGDFRKHLKQLSELGYDKQIDAYVKSDANQPVRIHKLQMAIIKELACEEALRVYQQSNLVAMQMKQNGIRIDYEKWQENCAKLEKISVKLEKDFFKKYGEVNINSSAQVGVMFKENGYNVPFKITVRGYKPSGDQKFNLKRDGFDTSQRKGSFDKLQGIVSVFALEKDKLFMECASDNVEKMMTSLDKLGYGAIASPMVNKTTLESAEEIVVKDYLALKQVLDIQKKFFGPKFERFFSFKDGSCRLHGTFQTVGARTTGRFSSVKPNLQNIPARVILWEKTKKEINVSMMCREVFLPEDGHVLVRLDYSGQENRWMAYFATGDEGEFIRSKYREDPDFDEHEFVVQQSGLLKDHDAKTARKHAKAIRFSVAYGSSVKSLAKRNNWVFEKAKEMVTKILDASPWFSITKKTLLKALSSGELTGIRTVLNRFIVCAVRDKAYRFYNYLIQGSSADQMKAAMVKNHEYIKAKKLVKQIIPVLSIHDEMCYSVDPNFVSFVKDIQINMEKAIDVDVPFLCDPEIGPNWAYTEEMEERHFEDRDYDDE